MTMTMTTGTRTKTSGAALVALAAAGLTVALPGRAAAQADRGSDPSWTCWRGAPSCAGYFLVEAQGILPVLATTRVQRFAGGMEHDVEAFEQQLEWNLGYMVGVSPAWAVGGAVTLGTGSYDALTGLKLRVRRWLTDEVSAELEGGAVFTHGHNAGEVRAGPTVDVRLNVADYGSLFVRWDGVDLLPQTNASGETWDEGGFQHALFVGVGTGSTPTVVGTAALGLAYVILLATVNWD